MKFAHQVPAVLAAVVAVSVLPGGRRFVGAQTSTIYTGLNPLTGGAANCTADDASLCHAKASCYVNQGDETNYCVCDPGYTGDGKSGLGNTGCNNVNECEDNVLNDCIAVSSDNGGFPASESSPKHAGGTMCVDRVPANPGDPLYECACPEGTVGNVTTGSVTGSPSGGDGKTKFSGGDGCPAVSSQDYTDEDKCEAACASPDASCFKDYLGETGWSCACNDGFKGNGTIQVGCTRLAPVPGEQQTLGVAAQKIDNATKILETYLSKKKDYEAAQCLSYETNATCVAAEAFYKEKLAEFNFASYTYDQAVDYQQQKWADWGEMNTTDFTGSDRVWREKAARDAWLAANTTEYEALAAKNEAEKARDDAEDAMEDVCDDSAGCVVFPGNETCVGNATEEMDEAKQAYDKAKDDAEDDNLIPEILTPNTADPYKDPFDEFVYSDSDGDLIPDKFDACPTQMGLRRDRVAMGDKKSTSVGGKKYTDGTDIGIANPGPQDFCPSGCPELDENGEPLDTDGDGINDCEDRCPFVYGILYNHAWTKDKWTNATNHSLADLDRNLDYNGCPDFDEDGIPDIFDLCPGCVWDAEKNVCTAVKINGNSKGGECYSGCPDPGLNPATGQPVDSDGDGVSDCDDRCPGTVSPVGIEYPSAGDLTTTHGCPDLDLDGVPDYLDYCPVNPGRALFKYTRKLEKGNSTEPWYNGGVPNRVKYLTILGCPDRDGDLVPDTVDMCDSCAFPNQDTTTPYQAEACNRDEEGWDKAQDASECNAANIDGVVVVDRVGCPLDSDQDGVYDGIDMCDGTIHSANDIHDEYAVVYKASDKDYTEGSNSTDGVLGCPKDDDGDGVANGIDQCPDVGGFINEDGCPIDSDGDGVSDCASDVGGDNSVLEASRILPTWPFTIGHLTGGNDDVCHFTKTGDGLGEPRSEMDAADNCCNVAYDNCEGTPKFVDVTKEYTPSDIKSPVNTTMGCSIDTDEDGVHDGRDRCPYSTKVEVDYYKGFDPDGNATDVSGLIDRDTFGCLVTLPAAWEITYVDVTTNATEDNYTLNGINDADGDANPDLEILFAVSKLLWDVQKSRGVALPPTLDDIKSGDLVTDVNQYGQHTYNNGTANEFFKATVFDYSCTKKFDDSTNPTSPTSKLLPTAVFSGVGMFPEEATTQENLCGDKNCPGGSVPVTVDVELNPDNLVGSEVWKIEPPFDEASIEFCLRVDLYSDNEESFNFMELKTKVKVDMTQGFKVSNTEVKRNDATTEETQIDIQYPLDACHCQGADKGYECVSATPDTDQFVTQNDPDGMQVCVRFQKPENVPAYVRMTDLKMFTCSQGTLSHTPVLDFVRAQDGTTSVDIFDVFDNNGNGLTSRNDRMIVVSTNLPSSFFGTTASTVDCQGTLVYDFEQNADIGNRRTAEAPIRAIAPPAKADEERKLNEAEGDFSAKVSLAPATGSSESSSMNAGLIAGVSVAGVVGAVAIGLLVARTVPAVRVSKIAGAGGRRPSYETDHSISDESPNHYLDSSEGYVA